MFLNNIDVACIQETQLSDKRAYSLKGYSVERCDGPRDGVHGVAVVVRQGINYARQTVSDSIQAIHLKIFLGTKTINLVNVYNPPTHILDKLFLDGIIGLPNLVLLGDFNAKHNMWGYQTVERNPFGTMLASVLEPTMLVILNVSVPTVYTYQGYHGVLDLSIVSPAFTIKCEYQVLRDPMSSDNFPILLQFDQILPKFCFVDKAWRIKKANWPKFQDALDRNTTLNMIDSADVDLSYNNVVTAVNKAAKISIPQASGKIRNRRLVYWRQEIKEAILARKKAFRQWSSSKLLADWIEYKRPKALAQRTIRVKAKNHWQNFCSSLDPSKPTKAS